ncbi:MAG: SurA N-terminal domain-containing protein, partial [Pseudomonadota bacterium]
MKSIIFILSTVLSVVQPITSWAEQQTPEPDKIVAKVNGKTISMQEYDSFLQSRQQGQKQGQGQADTVDFKEVLDEMIVHELIVEDALRQKLDQKPEFSIRMQALKRSLLMEFAAVNYMEANMPSEEELKAEYESILKQLGNHEYKASHIL